jgi:ligand-binding SRPBCC domain-containing protein
VRVITIVTDIAAPPEAVFDLCLDVQEHAKSLGDTGEKIVGGVATGLMELGDTLVLQGWHFGFRFKLGVKVTEYDRPRRFVDEMVSGPFKSVWHEHLFEHTPTGTRMKDTFKFAAPLGPLGLLAEALLLDRHMRRLLDRRSAHLKLVAERAPRP